MFKLLAIIMWISVLLHQLTEGFRFPGNRLAMKTNDNELEATNWQDKLDDDVLTVSNAIKNDDADANTDSADMMVEKRHQVRRSCACNSVPDRLSFGENTYPSHYIGKICDKTRNANVVCTHAGSCKETFHKMLVLKHKTDHQKQIKYGTLHHNISKDFYWDVELVPIDCRCA